MTEYILLNAVFAFEVLMVSSKKSTIFWDVIPCNQVEVYKYRLQLQHQRASCLLGSAFIPEDTGSIFL
jgi:hypothetical protein